MAEKKIVNLKLIKEMKPCSNPQKDKNSTWLSSFPQATSTTHNAVFTTVSITVTDTNDNRPSFVDTPYTGEVLENASLGMTVMRVTATDNDEVSSLE